MAGSGGFSDVAAAVLCGGALILVTQRAASRHCKPWCEPTEVDHRRRRTIRMTIDTRRRSMINPSHAVKGH